MQFSFLEIVKRLKLFFTKERTHNGEQRGCAQEGKEGTAGLARSGADSWLWLTVIDTRPESKLKKDSRVKGRFVTVIGSVKIRVNDQILYLYNQHFLLAALCILEFCSDGEMIAGILIIRNAPC